MTITMRSLKVLLADVPEDKLDSPVCVSLIRGESIPATLVCYPAVNARVDTYTDLNGGEVLGLLIDGDAGD